MALGGARRASAELSSRPWRLGLLSGVWSAWRGWQLAAAALRRADAVSYWLCRHGEARELAAAFWAAWRLRATVQRAIRRATQVAAVATFTSMPTSPLAWGPEPLPATRSATAHFALTAEVLQSPSGSTTSRSSRFYFAVDDRSVEELALSYGTLAPRPPLDLTLLPSANAATVSAPLSTGLLPSRGEHPESLVDAMLRLRAWRTWQEVWLRSAALRRTENLARHLAPVVGLLVSDVWIAWQRWWFVRATLNRAVAAFAERDARAGPLLQRAWSAWQRGWLCSASLRQAEVLVALLQPAGIAHGAVVAVLNAWRLHSTAAQDADRTAAGRAAASGLQRTWRAWQQHWLSAGAARRAGLWSGRRPRPEPRLGELERVWLAWLHHCMAATSLRHVKFLAASLLRPTGERRLLQLCWSAWRRRSTALRRAGAGSAAGFPQRPCTAQMLWPLGCTAPAAIPRSWPLSGSCGCATRPPFRKPPHWPAALCAKGRGMLGGGAGPSRNAAAVRRPWPAGCFGRATAAIADALGRLGRAWCDARRDCGGRRF